MTGGHDTQVWEPGWDGHERAQLLRMSRLTLEEKLAWLEEAQKLAQELQGIREKAPDER